MALLCRIGRRLVALESATGAFNADEVGVVHDPVDHRGCDGRVTDDLAPEKDSLLVMISDACSCRLAMS